MPERPTLTRRDLWRDAGLAGVALSGLLARESAAARPHHAPRARRVVQVFLTGGISQVDTFDYKPELARRHGQPIPDAEKIDTFNSKVGHLLKSPWEFRRQGRSGHYCSSLLPHLAGCVDDLTFLHGMTARSANHGPAQLQMNSGFIRNGFPCLGAWFSYAMGASGDDLPFFVVLPDPRGIPAGGLANWGSAFLPARHQATVLKPAASGPAIPDLAAPAGISDAQQRETYTLLRDLNRAHLRRREDDSELAARISAYELAGRMQVSVPEVVDLSGEPEHIRSLYGVDDPICGAFARNCLLARRMVERGVRIVQVYHGGSAMKPRVNWDAHEDVVQNHTQEARIMDRPVAGLIRDLKQRGLLADTLFLWVTEFGRTPFSQGVGKPGRDHNAEGFTVFMTGAGLRPGVSHGATDEFGHRAVEEVTTIYDLHATVLHLLGFDHERLTYYHNGLHRRLTDVHGHVIEKILA